MKRIIWLLSALTLAMSPMLVKAEDILAGGEVIETASFSGQGGHTVSGEVTWQDYNKQRIVVLLSYCF